MSKGITSVSIAQDPTSRRLCVTSPFNSDFVAQAKQIGGKWDGAGRCWTFPLENEQHLRALCMQVYGTTTGAPAPTRDALEQRLAQHLAAIVEIQEELAKLDAAEQHAGSQP